MTRVPPHDHGAEQCVLGSMMLSAEAANAVTDVVTTQDFYTPAHGIVFDVILGAVLGRQPTDPVAIAAALAETGELERIGGAPYLHTLVASVPTAASAVWYARIVADRAAMRRIIDAGTRTVQLGYDLDRDPAEAAAYARSLLEQATPHRSRTDLVAWSDIVGPSSEAIEAVGKAGRTPGLRTGLAALDDMTGGLKSGQLVIVGGRPGMGKSVFGIEVARHAALHDGRNVAVFSLEMTRDEIFNRIAAAETGINLKAINDGELTVNQWVEVNEMIVRTEKANLAIDDAAPNSLPDIIGKARRAHARRPLDLVVVDYLQLVTTGRRQRDGNREQEVSEISRGLKLLAKELGCPVIVAAQLNRNVEARVEKRPHLADLRESGSVEQDADIVILLFWELYYNAKAPRPRELEVIVGKNRHGPKGTVIALADYQHGRIEDPGIYPDRRH